MPPAFVLSGEERLERVQRHPGPTRRAPKAATLALTATERVPTVALAVPTRAPKKADDALFSVTRAALGLVPPTAKRRAAATVGSAA